MVAIVTTTPNKIARWPAAFILAAGLALVVFGGTDFLNALLRLNADTVIWELRHFQKVETADMQVSYSELIQHGRGGEALADSGFVALHRALSETDPALRTEWMTNATQETRQGLKLAPAQAGAWARLAWLDYQAGDSKTAAQDIKMSMLSGPVDPPLMIDRLKLALAMRPRLDSDGLDLLNRQIRLSWILAPDAIAALATDPANSLLIRDALANMSNEDTGLFVSAHKSEN
jgi:hypothetical protein